MSLSLADINVKHHILKYPTLFKDRLSALKHILLRDPDSHWNDDGIIVSYNISLEDVANANLDWKSIHALYPETNVENQPDIFDVFSQIALVQYQVIEKNINVVASNIHFDQTKFSDGDLTTISQYSPIFNVPDNVEESWRKAVNQVLQYLLPALKARFCLSENDSIAENWQYTHIFEMYQKLLVQKDKFSPSVSNEAKKSLMELWDSVLKK